MKLNNKGFAITAVLYGLLILFVVLTSSYLLVLSAKKDRVEKLVQEIEKNYNNDQQQANDGSLGNHIYNLYTNASKSIVTHNEIGYSYAPSVALMNDRLGGTTIGYDSGNIRYYGANPNNYIDIGDTYASDHIQKKWQINGYESYDECYSEIEYSWDDCETNYLYYPCNENNECTDVYECMGVMYSRGADISFDSAIYNKCSEISYNSGAPVLYRIIGLFDGKLKIVRDDSIGLNYWDNSGKTNWTNASLNKYLNENYYTNLIERNSDISNAIISTTHNLGGYNGGYNIDINKIYAQERGTVVSSGGTVSWDGNIALIYPSDYGYAVDFNECSITDLGSYSIHDCLSTNWLYDGQYNWTLTHYTKSQSSTVYYIDTNGDVTIAYGWPSRSQYGVRPVFYLNADLMLVSGDGTKVNPYKIST